MDNVQHLTYTEALEMMDIEVREQIKESLNMYKSVGVLIYENVDMSSSLMGDRFAIGYGPQNTIRELPQNRKSIVTPPRGYGWQYYMVAYATIPNKE